MMGFVCDKSFMRGSFAALRLRSPGFCGFGAGTGASEEQLSLAGVSGEGGGALELGFRFVPPFELGQKIAAHARKKVVAAKRRLGGQRVDELEPSGGTEGHRVGDGAVQLDDRRGDDLRK